MAQPATAVQKTNVTDITLPEDASTDDRSAAVSEAQGMLQLRLSSYQPKKQNRTEDTLSGRYRVDAARPLDYGHTHAKAFAVDDSENNARDLMALVCDFYHSHRVEVLEKMREIDHPNLLKIVDAGVVFISAMKQERFVIIYEKPQGRTLAQRLEEGEKFTEAQCVQQILKPLCQALMFFEENGISHLNINPSTIFIGEQLVLGDAISEPAALSQSFLYEPVERLLSVPYGKGEGGIRTDMYAVGVIAAEVIYGLDKQKKLDKGALTSMVVQYGSAQVMLGTRQLNEIFQDFFRGTLNDNLQERWAASPFKQWLGGKRFNLLSVNPQREALRSIEFMGKEFFSRRVLAQAMFENWEEAKQFLPESKLGRWLEQSLLKPEPAQRMTRLLEAYKTVPSKTERLANDTLAKAILILDPQGPVRMGKTAFAIDGIGSFISECFEKGNNVELQIVSESISGDMAAFWSDLQPPHSTHLQDLVWRLQKLRLMIHSNGVGLGMERTIYELNPHAPCLSPLLKGFHITSLSALLLALDQMAPTKTSDDSLFDRHLAAFVAAKLGIIKDVRAPELQEKEELVNNPELKLLRMLAKAQDKHKMKLPGLSLWVALRILNLVGHVHSRKFRKNLILQIKKYAEEGNIGYVLMIFFNEKMFGDDNLGFQQAWSYYQKNKAKILQLRSRDKLKTIAEAKGSRFATLISMLMLLYSVYYAIRHSV